MAQDTATLKPVTDKIIIELIPEKKQAGNIALPDNLNRYTMGKTERGKVKAVAAGRINEKGMVIPPEVKPGDIVVIKKAMGTQFSGGGKEFVICTSDEILAVED